MPKIQPIYYRDSKGVQPVDEFLNSIPEEHQAALDLQIERVSELCSPAQPDLPFPYSSAIDGPLRELRLHYGKHHYRILYRRSRNLIILLHAIYKTTKNVPPADIKIANDRWDDFKERMDANPPKKPRAIGRDAP